MPTPKPDFCPNGVIAYMTQTAGTHHDLRVLAKRFRVAVEPMRTILRDLLADDLIETCRDGRTNLYFIRSEQKSVATERPLLTVKPYNPRSLKYDEMIRRVTEARVTPSLHIERK